MRPEAVSTSGPGILLTLCAILIFVTLAILILAILAVVIVTIRGRRSDDSGDEDPGPGGRGPDPPHPPGGGPSIDELQWWPEFERQFRDYADEMVSQPSRSWRERARRPS
jgi:hypothetical protein